MKENALTQLPRATHPEFVTDVFQFEVLRKYGVWVFDDTAKGVQNEPFVCGMNEIIDGICRRFDIPPVDGQRIRATFCDERAVDHVAAEALVKDGKLAILIYDANGTRNCPSDYTPYMDTESHLHGAFCPVFKLYFPAGTWTPKGLFLLPEKIGP